MVYITNDFYYIFFSLFSKKIFDISFFRIWSRGRPLVKKIVVSPIHHDVYKFNDMIRVNDNIVKFNDDTSCGATQGIATRFGNSNKKMVP